MTGVSESLPVGELHELGSALNLFGETVESMTVLIEWVSVALIRLEGN
jgi:hypothetical protein